MWELLAALFLGAGLAIKVSSEKTKAKEFDSKFKSEQDKLLEFRRSVTNDAVYRTVREMMSTNRELVKSELKDVFAAIPELAGKEEYWDSFSRREHASNRSFVELILCIKRGCVPIVSQFSFDVFPYYIGDDLSGTPIYIGMSEDGANRFKKWAMRTLKTYGINVVLEQEYIMSPIAYRWRAP